MTGAPAVTTFIVKTYHSIVNRPIRRNEHEAIDDLFAGRSSYGEASFYWRTAAVAYFLLALIAVPVSLLLSQIHVTSATGSGIVSLISGAIFAYPFVGFLYSSLLANVTVESDRKFRATWLYKLHDFDIFALSIILALILNKFL